MSRNFEKTPNFEKKEHLNPKIDFMGRNRSEIIRVIQQTHPPRYRLRSSRDIRLKAKTSFTLIQRSSSLYDTPDANMKIALNVPRTFSNNRDVSPAF
ncbi:hypothetical protein T01_9724 [Trichinella spiralis]|uniref:Uncharacterized protein n=1 Tax=Trichinella spiralis TaxID=6334 RepID=A0A0V1B3S5_TRISP|nr:hypothetical protein T01_9724 [Trichinella spiralis]